MIQRSRKTCQELSKAAGKTLRFPRRTAPQMRRIRARRGRHTNDWSPSRVCAFSRASISWSGCVESSRRPKNKIESCIPPKSPRSCMQGIKLAAFLTEQYRRDPIEGRKTYQEEVLSGRTGLFQHAQATGKQPRRLSGHLAEPRRRTDRAAPRRPERRGDPIIAPHLSWVRAPLFAKANVKADADSPEEEIQGDEGKPSDILSEEAEGFLNQAISERQFEKKLRDFRAETFDIARWRDDIASDLGLSPGNPCRDSRRPARAGPEACRLRAHLDAGTRLRAAAFWSSPRASARRSI